LLLVVAVDGHPLLERGESSPAQIQEEYIDRTVAALSPLAEDHDLVITHGPGPHAGLLTTDHGFDPDVSPLHPLDVLDSHTRGMISYLLLEAFENALPGREVVNLTCQTEVAADDLAFEHPTTFVGPFYTDEESRSSAALRGWRVHPDGSAWRRLVASPEPLAMVQLPTIRMLLGDSAVVICDGGGGIPVTRGDDGRLRGVHAVIDSNLGASLLARDLRADALLILTDPANSQGALGADAALPIGWTTPASLRARSLPDRPTDPKVEAACRFVETTGNRAMIGRLADAGDLVRGVCGTVVEPVSGEVSVELLASGRRG
jgi:carbamate kinase